MKKYIYYILATDDTDEIIFHVYNNAVSEYSKHESATLYGKTFMGDMSVIFSK